MEELLPDAEFEAQQRFCKIRVSSQCDCMVQGNPELIYRAIENIVRNAIRYTRQESVVELKIELRRTRRGTHGHARCKRLRAGSSRGRSWRIFSARSIGVDDARQLDTGGFGVGLAIADRAVRLHHGEVRARNRPEGGLIVSLKLPCEK